MFYFRDARRQLMFETAGDLKAFLCEEYEPAVLARAVAADMIDRAMEMGYDDKDYLYYSLTRALLGEVDFEYKLMDLIEYLGEAEEETEMEGTGATIGYCEED